MVPPSARQVAEANQLRKALRIHAYGNNIPPLVQSAHELSEAHGLRPFLHRNIMTAGGMPSGSAIASHRLLLREPRPLTPPQAVR
jgi:hypothetical protein